MALFITLRTEIIRVLLGSGRFSLNDTRLTAAALALFSISALSQCLLLLFTRAFYSAGHTKKPFLINLVSGIATVLIAYGLTKYFAVSPGFRNFVGGTLGVSDLKDFAVLMLPLGYSIGTIGNGIVHWIGFEKDFGRAEGSRSFSKLVLPSFFQSLFAALVVGLTAAGVLLVTANVFPNNTLADVFLHGFIAGIAGIAAGLVALALLGNREFTESWKGVQRRFAKTRIIATDQEIV
jgi:peptidoglycan biosynthesis protein MviN/MurJ (putative lipid II flippase)